MGQNRAFEVWHSNVSVGPFTGIKELFRFIVVVELLHFIPKLVNATQAPPSIFRLHSMDRLDEKKSWIIIFFYWSTPVHPQVYIWGGGSNHPFNINHRLDHRVLGRGGGGCRNKKVNMRCCNKVQG